LKEVDSKLEALSRNIEAGGVMSDQPILDVQQILQSTSVLKNVAALRVVKGSSQYYKPAVLTRSLYTETYSRKALRTGHFGGWSSR